MASANNQGVGGGGGVDMWGRILQRATLCPHMNDLAGMVYGHH